MSNIWRICAVWIPLTLGLAAASNTAGSSAQQLPARFDAEAYAGLLGPRDRHNSLTHDPRDITISVNDLARPFKYDDAIASLPEHFRTIVAAGCRSDAVVVARPVQEEPFLNPAETWVLTRYHLEVSDVIKASGVQPYVGQKLVYVHPSGAMTVGGRNISTVVTAYPRLELGREYLFFLQRIPQTGHYSSALDIPVLAGGSKWVAHAGADAEVPEGLRVGVLAQDIVSYTAMHCRGAR